MIIASADDKSRVVEILSLAFERNKSVNDVIGNGEDKLSRIRAMMAYAFEVCYAFGRVVLSEDRNACALVLFPDQKRFSFRSLWLDLGFLVRVAGSRPEFISGSRT